MIERNTSTPHDPEDRGWWHIHGEALEEKFVELCRTKLNLPAQINPAKIENKYAPDLVINGKLADLKTQNTPFFSARRYKVDPRFAVTFNRKDYERYKRIYPDISIYFWIDWIQTSSQWGSVAYFGGVFHLQFEQLAAMIEAGAPEHYYIHRRTPNDPNAKSSFVLDIRCFTPLFTAERRENLD